MARFGARLVTNGYAILPIGPGTKKPGPFQRGAWTDYPEWNRAMQSAPPPTSRSRPGRHGPGCGIGIVGGAVAALDIDIVEDAELGPAASSSWRANDWATRRRCASVAPRSACWSIARPSPFAGSSATAGSALPRAAVRGLCRPSRHRRSPMSGPRRGWPISTSTICPTSTPQMAAAFIDEALCAAPEPRCARRSLRHERRGPPMPAQPCQVGTLAAIQAALDWLPNAELDYDSWMRIGMALKGALGRGGCGRSSPTGRRRRSRTCPRPRRRPGRASSPTGSARARIYHLAMERGWRPEPDMSLDGSQPADAVHPAAGLLARLDAPHAATSEPPPATPFTLTIPDGLVGDLARYMIDTARRPQPLLVAWAPASARSAR